MRSTEEEKGKNLIFEETMCRLGNAAFGGNKLQTPKKGREASQGLPHMCI